MEIHWHPTSLTFTTITAVTCQQRGVNVHQPTLHHHYHDDTTTTSQQQTRQPASTHHYHSDTTSTSQHASTNTSAATTCDYHLTQSTSWPRALVPSVIFGDITIFVFFLPGTLCHRVFIYILNLSC